MDWDIPPWQEIIPEQLTNYMGEKPGHFPKTEVKIGYGEDAVHVLFRVEDRYVRAVAEADQDSVCRDSCVEFFFTPGPDVSVGYFNLEMNCGGTMLFHFHPGEGGEALVIPRGDCTRIARTHSLPRIVEPEISTPLTWIAGFSIPIALLEKYCRVNAPAPGAVWRGNFYKCGDGTSHPHWLTWAPADYPRPNFHLPRSFGVLQFA